MSDQPAVRVASQDDIEAIKHLWRHLEEHQKTYRMFPLVEDAPQLADAMFKEAFDDPDYRIFLVERAGKVLGMCLAHRTESKGFSHAKTVDISKMVIESPYRGRGYGRMLVEAVEDFACESGATYLTARAFSDNLAGTGFWGSLDFDPRYEERARPVRKK